MPELSRLIASNPVMDIGDYQLDNFFSDFSSGKQFSALSLSPDILSNSKDNNNNNNSSSKTNGNKLASVSSGSSSSSGYIYLNSSPGKLSQAMMGRIKKGSRGGGSSKSSDTADLEGNNPGGGTFSPPNSVSSFGLKSQSVDSGERKLRGYNRYAEGIRLGGEEAGDEYGG